MKGQAQNPRGKPHMRSIQIILNHNLFQERQAVTVLDWARGTKDIETGKLYTDRRIVVEALAALGEKYQEGFAPPHRIQNLDEIINVVMQLVSARLDGFIPASARDQVWADTRTQINNLVETGNLVGESYKYEGDD